MTLQEAHEIQRRELMSLRAENTRLKKQTSSLFPVEEKESLERHIRYLEQIIKTKDKRYDSARSYWKCTKNICSVLITPTVLAIKNVLRMYYGILLVLWKTNHILPGIGKCIPCCKK